MAHEMFVWQSLSTEGTFLLTLRECASSLAKTPVSKGRMKAVAYGFFSYDGKPRPRQVGDPRMIESRRMNVFHDGDMIRGYLKSMLVAALNVSGNALFYECGSFVTGSAYDETRT